MKVYHRTIASVAQVILNEGAHDAEGTYGTDRIWRGFWLADQILDANEGAFGDHVLEYEIPESELTKYEWIEEGKGYREFLVPADVVNRHGPPRMIPD
jgi:hypothetical protein